MLPHRVLFDEKTIAARIAELARQIHRDLPSPTPVIVGLLTGSFVFLADLVRAGARLGCEPHIDFMAVSHYGAGTEATGSVKIYKETGLDLRRRAVLVVDDILDSGVTLRTAREYLLAREPEWLRICVLLDKPSRRQVEIQADYVGFEVPDVWVIGYGLDSAGEGRALPYIAAVEGAA